LHEDQADHDQGRDDLHGKQNSGENLHNEFPRMSILML
jgi:hypothetical protein